MIELLFGIATLDAPQNWYFTPHEHEALEIVGVLQGAVKLHAAGEEWSAQAGELCLLPAKIPHGWSSSGGARLTVAHVTSIRRDLRDCLFPRPHPRLLQLSPAHFTEYAHLHEQVKRIEQHSSQHRERLLHAYLEALLLIVLEGSQEQQPEQALLHEVVAYMRAHLGEALCIEELAHAFLVSKATLRRHFHKGFGVSPKQYLQELRFAEAKQLLSTSQLSIQEIAMRSGFFDSAHFSSAFHKRYGCTPSAWRKAYC